VCRNLVAFCIQKNTVGHVTVAVFQCLTSKLAKAFDTDSVLFTASATRAILVIL